VDWLELLHTFELENDLIFDQNVDPISAIEAATLIVYRHRFFHVEIDIVQSQLVSQALLVGGLQQPGAQSPVHFNSTTDHFVGKLAEIRFIAQSPKL